MAVLMKRASITRKANRVHSVPFGRAKIVMQVEAKSNQSVELTATRCAFTFSYDSEPLHFELRSLSVAVAYFFLVRR